MADVSFTYQTQQSGIDNKLLNFIIENADAMAEEANVIMAQNQFNRASHIGEEAVAKWYGAYDPYIYRRRKTDNLYDVICPVLDGEDFEFVFDPDMLGLHHQNNEYVYKITFKKGWHGGPILRTPVPYYTDVLGFALRTKAPFSMIEEKWDEYLNNDYLEEQKQAAIEVAIKYAEKYNRKKRR